MRKAIFPGSFDPMDMKTLRGFPFDEIVIAIESTPKKIYVF
jgi:phosphopantetheine adenylyltransferase